MVNVLQYIYTPEYYIADKMDDVDVNILIDHLI